MRKRYSRILAGIMAAVMLAGGTGITRISAQEMAPEAEAEETSDTVTELLNQVQEADAETIQQVKAIVYNCAEYGLRSEPCSTQEVATLYSGHQVVIQTCVVAEDGTKWYGITTSVSGIAYEGYIQSDYILCNEVENLDTIPVQYAADDANLSTEEIEIVEDIDLAAQKAASDFEASIAQFPESYKANLRALHAAHPNWIFVPQITNIDWDTFIEAEMVRERNLVPRSMDDSYKGKQEWAYNPATGEYYGLSGYNWVQASQAAVEYYADPRNFLREETIFQFELLTYNSKYQTEEGVEAIINGTFMSHTKMPDDVVTYAKAFCLAGAQTNVSPYMLAARVRQEQGVAGSSPLISGTYPGYEGYYNFFNIHAYGNTETEIYVNGLSYARENNWNSRYNSIAGGANVLSSSYISKGQDTLYLQKFDVDDSYYGLFSHQYMQNVLGACNEGKTAYEAYASIGILDNSYVFKIPVYKNMPVTAAPKPENATYQEKEVKAFITRLYQNILGREPDEAGLIYWYSCLTSGEDSAASVASKFVFSKEFEKQKVSDSVFVERMYVTMMNRKPDAAGKKYWLDILDSGCSRRYVLSCFINSEEFTKICNSYGVTKGAITLTEARDKNIGATKFVTRLYQTTLNRKPDVEGLNYWVNAITTKQKTPYDVAEQIVCSKEFANYNYTRKEYVRILYRTFLDREPDTAGFEYWVNQLNSGVSRTRILKEFANSEEFKKLAKSYGL